MEDYKLNFTEKDDKKIAKHFSDGDHPYYGQNLDRNNLIDAQKWLDGEEMNGLVSPEGIIGYIHQDHIDDVITALNLLTILRHGNQKETDNE